VRGAIAVLVAFLREVTGVARQPSELDKQGAAGVVVFFHSLGVLIAGGKTAYRTLDQRVCACA